MSTICTVYSLQCVGQTRAPCCLSLGCCLFLGCRKDILSHTDRSDRSATGAELLWQNRIVLDIFHCFWLRSTTSHQCAFWIRAFRHESLLPWSNICAETTLSGTQSVPGQWTWVSKCTVAIQTRILLYLFGFQSLDLSWQQVYVFTNMGLINSLPKPNCGSLMYMYKPQQPDWLRILGCNFF